MGWKSAAGTPNTAATLAGSSGCVPSGKSTADSHAVTPAAARITTAIVAWSILRRAHAPKRSEAARPYHGGAEGRRTVPLTRSKSASPTDVFIDVHASPSRTHAARSRTPILGAPIAALLGNRTESSLRPYQQVVRSRCRMFRQDHGSPVHARATAVVATFRQIANRPSPSVCWTADFRSLVGCTPGGHSSAGRAGLRMRPIAVVPRRVGRRFYSERSTREDACRILQPTMM